MLRDLKPTDIICGYNVRPGYYDMDGATPVRGGINFTISSVYATSCTLLLFAPGARTPYVHLPFPESYRIGSTYSMIVFGLEVDKFEYAHGASLSAISASIRRASPSTITTGEISKHSLSLWRNLFFTKCTSGALQRTKARALRTAEPLRESARKFRISRSSA